MRADGAALPGGRPAWLAAGLVLIGLTSPALQPGRPPVKGEATFSASGGYARLVIKLAEDVDSQVSTAGSILVIRFKRPVDIPVEKTVRRGARLCRVGAARPRRLGDPAVAGAQGDRQHHDGGRAGVRRSVARRLERSAARASRRSGPRIVRARAGRRARLAPAARGRGGQETSADAGPRLGAADLRALRIRNARRRQRLQRAERPEAVAAVQRRAHLRPRGRQAGGAVEHRLDQPEDRRRNLHWWKSR